MALQDGIQLLVGFVGSALFESSGGLIQRGWWDRRLAQKNSDPQRRDQQIASPIHSGHSQFSIMPLRERPLEFYELRSLLNVFIYLHSSVSTCKLRECSLATGAGCRLEKLAQGYRGNCP
jgi:hypothetical protein